MSLNSYPKFILPALAMALLACGTAAPYQEGQGNSLVGGAAAEPSSRAVSLSEGGSATQVLPRKPPLDPTNTPFPTLEPDPPGVEEEIARLLREDAARKAARNAPGPSLAEQTAEFTRDNIGNRYDYIVRGEVKSHRVVQPNTDITWSDDGNNPPYMRNREGNLSGWRRAKLEISTTYQGSVPDGYEVIAPAFLPDQALDVGQEYILFLLAAFVAEDEFPGQMGRYHYNTEQLEAVGGRGGLASPFHTWIIEGETAWRLPVEHFMSLDATTDLPAAKANGESLPLADLEAAIKAGVEN